MSVTMCWYKPPSLREELGSSYDLKWPLAKRYGRHDGSCHEKFILTEEAIPFLEGLAYSDKYQDATKLIEDLKEYGEVEVEYK